MNQRLNNKVVSLLDRLEKLHNTTIYEIIYSDNSGNEYIEIFESPLNDLSRAKKAFIYAEENGLLDDLHFVSIAKCC